MRGGLSCSDSRDHPRQSHDTPFFAVNCLDHCWRSAGRARYLHTAHLAALADSGGSNGFLRRVWKYGLQRRSCNPHRLSVRVARYLPGQSKYNAAPRHAVLDGFPLALQGPDRLAERLAVAFRATS